MAGFAAGFLSGFIIFATDALLIAALVAGFLRAGSDSPLFQRLMFGVLVCAKVMFLLVGVYMALGPWKLPGEAFTLGAILGLSFLVVAGLLYERRQNLKRLKS